MEGVGLGAVAAAAKHEAVDVSKLITWQQGAPVPFAFLAKVRPGRYMYMVTTACCASLTWKQQCSNRINNVKMRLVVSSYLH